MQDILTCAMGLDIHRDVIVACLAKGELGTDPEIEIRSFSTLIPEMRKLRDWVLEAECRYVAMESTGIYWQPIYEMLEPCFDGQISILVVNARHMKNVPGCKTDMRDAQWIATLLRAGLLKGSFIPDKTFRELRHLTRYHSVIVDHSVGVAAVLEDGLVQLPDVLGLQFLQSQSTLPEECVQSGIDEALVTLVSGALNGGSCDLQPLPQEVRKQRGFLLWGFRFHDPGTVLLLQLLQAGLGLAFVALHRNAQGNGFLPAFSIFIIQVQNSGVTAVSFEETSGNFSIAHRNHPFLLSNQQRPFKVL